MPSATSFSSDTRSEERMSGITRKPSLSNASRSFIANIADAVIVELSLPSLQCNSASATTSQSRTYHRKTSTHFSSSEIPQIRENGASFREFVVRSYEANTNCRGHSEYRSRYNGKTVLESMTAN